MTERMINKNETAAEQQEKSHPKVEHDSRFVRPLADIVEAPDHYLIYVDLPGLKKENIKIQLEAENLILEGTINRDYWKEGKLICNECFHTRYHRDFHIGYDIDRSKISAEFTNGVLAIKLVKQEDAKPREIQIN